MIGYITLGSNDIKTSSEFYDEIFKVLGASRVYDHNTYCAWARDSESIIFSITNPADGKRATVGNGTMIALEAESREQVDFLYGKGLAMGGQDEGSPSERSGGYYCAYVRDLDGNKLNFHVKPNVT